MTVSIQEISEALSQIGILRGSSLRAQRNADSIEFVTVDSRQARPGGVFIAYAGVKVDSHTFLPEVTTRGISLVIVERDDASFPASTPRLVVSNGRAAWSTIAALLHGNPQQKLSCLAVTGTNGKTSTVWFWRELLRILDIPGASAGTLGVSIGESMVAGSHTTPDPEDLFSAMAGAVKACCEWFAMEVSSHALDQRRVAPVRFSGGIFTSFSRDHLDYHGTMDEYLASKLLLPYSQMTSGAPFLAHESVAESLDSKFMSGPLHIYGQSVHGKGNARYTIDRQALSGADVTISFSDENYRGHLPFFAETSIANFVAAFVMSRLVGLPSIPTEKWRSIRQVPGRMERIVISSTAQLPFVFVDYAHTPDALEKALSDLRELCDGELFVVFGCGGDRDKGKRPQMGAIAGKLADRIYVTSDNPRTEDPKAIIDEIIVGIDNSNPNFVAESDRRLAIQAAIFAAGPHDVVLIAGKGHEDYQIIGSEKIPFDDRDVGRLALMERVRT